MALFLTLLLSVLPASTYVTKAGLKPHTGFDHRRPDASCAFHSAMFYSRPHVSQHKPQVALEMKIKSELGVEERCFTGSVKETISAVQHLKDKGEMKLPCEA